MEYRSDELKHKHTPDENRLPRDHDIPPLSHADIAAANAHTLTSDIAERRKGSASASEHVLSEVRQMSQGGYLQEMAKDLEQSGDAKVTYGKDGEVQHIVFNGHGSEAPVDIDVQKQTVNGESPEQLRQKSLKQAEDFLGAEFADPRTRDKSGEPFTPEVRDDAGKLINALMEKDLSKLTEVAQRIMRNPEEAKKVEELLDRVTFPSQFRLDRDESGKPRMNVEGGPFDSVIIPADGQPKAVKTDWMGRPTGEPSDLNKSFEEGSHTALWRGSEAVQSAELYLQMVGRLPADGYTNMNHLEQEYLH